MVLAVAKLGHADAAARLQATLAPLSEHMACIGQAAVLGSTHHYLGQLCAVLGDLDEAASHLVRAIDRHIAAGSPPLVAVSQAALAELLLRRRRPKDTAAASRLIGEAGETAARLSMETIGRQCKQLAAAPRRGGLT
jgi:hypothetical protein